VKNVKNPTAAFAAPPLIGEALGAIFLASLERGGGTAVPEGFSLDVSQLVLL